MARLGPRIRFLAIASGALFVGPAARAETARVSAPAVSSPQAIAEFGTTQSVTTISAASFVPSNDARALFFSSDLSRHCQCNDQGIHYYANLNLPAGAVIDFLGLESKTGVNGVLGAAIWQRGRYDGAKTLVAGVSSTPHGWDTDYSGLIGYQITRNVHQEFVIEVEQVPYPVYQDFGWVEVWWHRGVSPAPANATFSDVPTSDPFFQAIEALAASGITSGCAAGQFCPNQPVTRAEMAKFLAKALGLNWPY